MRRRKRLAGSRQVTATDQLIRGNFRSLIVSIVIVTWTLIMMAAVKTSKSLLMLDTNCLSGAPACSCSWKGGKFVANCASQNLNLVPKNDYFDYLVANSGNNQMPTLNRDIQQLNLASNNISSLLKGEFYRKKFRNLQKIYLNTNQLVRIHSNAFYKMTGLIELDLSENLLSELSHYSTSSHESNDTITNDEFEPNEVDTSRKAEVTTLRNLTTSKRSNELQASGKLTRERTSFLQDLNQLRHLNLASNQLKRIRKFTFSQLAQLRQLILSRNQIDHIDKRAFDGLNLLNILHLDGNRLYHLDGGILLRLPQLYAIQLGGRTNGWRCDCRLRKLVRHLMGKSRARNALIGSNDAGTNILQDEPQCSSEAAHSSEDLATFATEDSIVQADGTGSGGQNNPETGRKIAADPIIEAGSRTWKSMRLSDFACPPKLAADFMASAISEQVNSSSSQAELSPPEVGWSPIGGNRRSQPEGVKSNFRAAHYRHHQLDNEPLELNCAFRLTDELDLDFQQVEWWQFDGRGRQPEVAGKTGPNARLLWSSSGGGGGKQINGEQQKDASQMRTQTAATSSYAIIDYVTRANGSSWDDSDDDDDDDDELTIDEFDQMTKSKIRDKSNGKVATTTMSLVRVSHLVMIERPSSVVVAGSQSNSKNNNQKPERRFVCRITNQLGEQLDAVHSVYSTVTSAPSTEAGAELRRKWKRRRQLSHLGRMAAASSAALAGPWVAQLAATSGARPSAALWQEKARDAVAKALAGDERGPLFVPLDLPEALTNLLLGGPQDGHSGNSSGGGSAVGRSQSGSGDHQRPLTRHANGSSTVAAANQGQQLGSLLQQPSTSTGQSHLIASVSHPSEQQQPATRLKSLTLESVALSLIGRFTSNRRSLFSTGDNQDSDLSPEEEEDDLISGSDARTNPNAASGPQRETQQFVGTGSGGSSFRSLAKQAYARYLDRWLQRAVGEAPLLLGLCAGLLAGCLVTGLLLLLVRLSCARQRRVFAASSDLELDKGGGDNQVQVTGGHLEPDSESPMGQAASGSSSSTRTSGSQRKLISSSSPEVALLDDSNNKLKRMEFEVQSPQSNGRHLGNSCELRQLQQQQQLNDSSCCLSDELEVVAEDQIISECDEECDEDESSCRETRLDLERGSLAGGRRKRRAGGFDRRKQQQLTYGTLRAGHQQQGRLILLGPPRELLPSEESPVYCSALGSRQLAANGEDTTTLTTASNSDESSNYHERRQFRARGGHSQRDVYLAATSNHWIPEDPSASSQSLMLLANEQVTGGHFRGCVLVANEQPVASEQQLRLNQLAATTNSYLNQDLVVPSISSQLNQRNRCELRHPRSCHLQQQQTSANQLLTNNRTPNSSLASPLASTSSTSQLTSAGSHQQQVAADTCNQLQYQWQLQQLQQQQPAAANQFIQSSSISSTESTGQNQVNPQTSSNFVYLEDALQLLQSSMSDCLLLPPKEYSSNSKQTNGTSK